MSFSGHLPQILGDDAETAFYQVASSLGYTKQRTRNIRPSIDLIADFDGTQQESAVLKRPIFSPEGMTAFSVKRGAFVKKDLNDLTSDIQKGKESKDKKDEILQKLAGGVLVSGTLLTEPKLNSTLKTWGVFVWDIRRLIFYSKKVKICSELLDFGPVKEEYLEAVKGTFMIAPVKLDIATMYVRAYAFVDDHDLVIQRDHAEAILKEIYSKGLKPLQNALFELQVIFSLHSVGSIRRDLVEEAYRAYAKVEKEHPRVTFSNTGAMEIQSYAAAPWTAMFAPSSGAFPE